jgi:hypothetical protein
MFARLISSIDTSSIDGRLGPAAGSDAVAPSMSGGSGSSGGRRSLEQQHVRFAAEQCSDPVPT